MESHSFNIEHAILFTQEGATLLQHHYYWYKRNKANNRNFHNGSYWTFNAASAYCDIFPYLSEKQVRTLHQNFIDAGLMIEGNYNQTKFDRTKWFALTELGISCFTEWNIHKVYSNLQKVKWILQNVKSKSLKVNSCLRKGITIPVVNTDINTNINTEDSSSGDVPSLAPNPKATDEKAEFSAWLLSIGCSKLSQSNFFIEKEKSCAKKEKYTLSGYVAALQAIEKYMSEKPKYLADKTDFGRIVDNFAVPIDVQLGKAAFSAFFGAKFGEGKETYSKGEVTALKTIADALKTNAGSDAELEKHFKHFFAALGALPKYQNPFNCNLSFIAKDLPAIFYTLKHPNAAPAATETFKERDERLAKEKDAERQLRQFEQERIKVEKAQIQRFIDAGYPLTPEMLQSAAYRNLYGNGETF